MAISEDYASIREKLIQERTELTLHVERLEELASEIRSDRGGGGSGVSNHMAEGASSTFDQERNLALIGNLQRTLEQIESALKRIDQGTYGMCQVCNRPIDRARLQTLPYAAQCIDCQARLEGR